MTLEPFFAGKSICIIGASSDGSRIGGRPVRYLLSSGYSGTIYPINPNKAEVLGLKAYPSVEVLPDCPELAIVALPRESVLNAVSACVRRGVPAITIFSSGFAETDQKGSDLQHEIARLARESGTRILGPNANGTMGVASGLYACFTPLLDRGLPQPGGVAIVTQSAALGTYLLEQFRVRGLGVSYWAHTGNEADITLLDIIAFAIEQHDVRIVVAASEVLRDPSRLRPVLKRATERGVSVAFLQVGQSEAGERAAASHTGALVAAQSALTQGLLRQEGAILATSLRELADIAEARIYLGGSKIERVGVITTSGGIGIMMADALDIAGVSLPTLSEGLQNRIRGEIPFGNPANPVDVTAQILNEPDRLGAVIGHMKRSGEVDLVIVFIPSGTARDPLVHQLAEAARAQNSDHQGRLRFGVLGTLDEEARDIMRQAGIAIWQEPADVAHALASLRPRARRPNVSTVAGGDPAADVALRAAAHGGVLAEIKSKDLLRSLGLPVIEDVIADTADAAGKAAAEFDGPVALKLHMEGLAHKAKIGGVRLNLNGFAAAADAARDILRIHPGGQILVEPMVHGLELFVAITDTADFGPVAICGFGGTDIEQRRQVAYRWLPLLNDDLEEMLAESGVAAVLDALHVRREAIEQLRSVFATLGDWFRRSSRTVESVEINPLIVTHQGSCAIVDALIELKSEEERSNTGASVKGLEKC